MSALTRDPLASPPLRRASEPAGWLWPDRNEVTAPPVRAGRPLRSGEFPPEAHWPSDLPDRAWPPMPEIERPQRPAPAPEAVASRAPLAQAGQGWPGLVSDLDPDEPAPPGTMWRAYGFYDSDPHTGPQTRPRPAGRFADAADATLRDATSLASLDWTDPMPAGPAPSPLHDPSPSRLAYRMHRLWLTPLVRNFLRLGLPMLLLAAFVGGWLSKPDNRELVSGFAISAVERVQNQPMFQVGAIEVISRSPEVALGVEQLLGLHFPVSSWELDLPALRARAEALDAVEGAWLQIRSGGVLEVRITERAPAMIWRNAEGLDLVDAQGHRVARLATRVARADLPLIAGAGAPAAIAEAAALWTAAAPIQGRIRGLVRVGERRWDVMLDRDQRILLPETGAVEALERVVAMSEGAQQLLSRDVLDVDMRQPSRPTLRLTPGAMAELTRNRSQSQGAPRR